jgi:hypothetical protein
MIKTFEGFDFFLSQVKPNLKDVTNFAFAFLLEQYKTVIDQAESHLIKAAREQKSDTDKARFIAAIEQCQRMKGGMYSAFGHSMMEALKPMHGHPTDPRPSLSFQGSVSALASHAREDETFMLGAATKAYKQYEELTNEIANALQKTLVGARITRENNPFNPMIIANAIFASLKITSIHSVPKKEILVLFDNELLKKMDAFYIQALQHLREAGIRVKIPNANDAIISDDDIPLLEPATDEIDTIDSDFNALIEDGVIAPDYHTPHYTPLEFQYADDPGKKIITIPVKAIDQLLANLQKGYDPASDGELPEYVKSHLVIESKTGEINVIRRHDENIINLISLVFDEIAKGQDKRMADLFYRLKVPYTRLVLTDELFFHDTSHPARNLLDELLSLTYSTHDDETLFKQVQTCVMKILMRYNGENTIFSDLVKAVKLHHENNSGPFADSLEAMRQQLEAEEQKRFAYNTVIELINQRCKRLSRRLRFHVLVEKIMAQVLVEILLKEGNESKSWQIGSKLLDIILILTDKSESPHFKTLSDDLINIIRKLSQFLTENGIEAERKKVFLEQLQEIQTLLAQGKKLSDIDDDELSHTYDVDMIIDDYDSEMVADIDTARIGSEHLKSSNARELELIPANKRPQKNSAMAFVKNLKLGQWMNFVVDNERIPCSPSYYSRQKDSYVFCDRHNKKLFERKRAEIVEDIVTGFACPLESTLSFDGNLARVITRLNNLH